MPFIPSSLNVICFLCAFARGRALLSRIQRVPSLSPNEGYTHNLVFELYSLASVIFHILQDDGLQVNFDGYSLSEARDIVQIELLSLRFLIEDIMHRPLPTVQNPIVQIRVNGFSWYQPSTDFHSSTASNVSFTRRNGNHHMSASNILSINTMPNEHPTLLPLFPEQPLSHSIPTSGTELGDTNNTLFIPTIPNEHPTLLPLFPEQPLSRSIPTSGTGLDDTSNILSIPTMPNEYPTLLPLFPEQPLS